MDIFSSCHPSLFAECRQYRKTETNDRRRLCIVAAHIATKGTSFALENAHFCDIIFVLYAVINTKCVNYSYTLENM